MTSLSLPQYRLIQIRCTNRNSSTKMRSKAPSSDNLKRTLIMRALWKRRSRSLPWWRRISATVRICWIHSRRRSAYSISCPTTSHLNRRFSSSITNVSRRFNNRHRHKLLWWEFLDQRSLLNIKVKNQEWKIPPFQGREQIQKIHQNKTQWNVTKRKVPA